MLIERRLMDEHTDGPCANKPVECPFAVIGCKAQCTQGTLTDHLNSACPSHLSHALAALTTQQESIRALQAAGTAAAAMVAEVASLRERVGQLESGAVQQSENLKRAVRQVDGELRVTIKDEVANATSINQRRLNDGLSKLSKSQAAADKESRTAAARQVAAYDKLHKTVDAVAARLAALSEGSR
eukprot:CAMPEP_0174724988 /NCGR_PEP_ID=MMETSP1094-20130205/44591_1 /TAXON_ID=156173 /ORGANISM="Chrysochromulina brevifilum, Strain UTEX LB 985" /LENGTH=184 /DNA_ID=CAMNT_0015926291 /DNA_START=155 /DNA_END=709 /DNA_ORIENTATION=+